MMTNLITLTIPNDDSTALYHFGKSLIDMSASVSGAREFVVITRDEYDDLTKHVGELTYKLNIDTTEATAALDSLNTAATTHCHVEVDTTPQQVESLSEAVLTITGVEINSEPASDEEITGCDKSGTSWDERIHSTSKALNADGTWRLRRKPKDMDEAAWAAFVESVKAELSEGLETPAEAYLTDDFVVSVASAPHDVDPDTIPKEDFKEIACTVEPPVTPPGDDFHTDAGVITEETVAGIPPLPVPPPVVVAPPAPVQAALSEGIARYGDAMSELAKNDGDVQWDFPRLMTFLTERHGKIDVTTVNTLLAQDGLASLQELNVHPDKIDPFVARVKAHLGE